MSKTADIIRALAACGAPAEGIADFLEELEKIEAQGRSDERKREQAKERQRRFRARQQLRAEVDRRIEAGEPVNPRALGINPRALGTNPRARRS